MKSSPALIIPVLMIPLGLTACHRSHGDEKGHHQEHHKIVVTSPQAKDVVVTQQYVCQIQSRRHITVRAQHKEAGYLEEIHLREGQAVKAGDVLFKIVPVLYKANLDVELAEVKLAQVEYDNTLRLFKDKVVSQNELAIYEAKLAKARNKAKEAEAKLNLTVIRAPFDGIIDRLHEQQGSLIKEGDKLTSLSDNSVMWVYFNVPEARYFEYKARAGRGTEPSRIELSDSRIELVLANGSKFGHDAGHSVTVEGEFNIETGNIAFRADFPNPDGLLRHGQTGNVLIHRTLPGAVVIPQRATFEVLDKRYVYVVGGDDVVRQREIVVGHEMDDVFVVAKGLDASDRIVLEGVRQVHDGEKVEYETRPAGEALANQKHHAE